MANARHGCRNSSAWLWVGITLELSCEAPKFAGLRQLQLLVGRPAGLLQPHFLTCRAQSTRPHGCSSATKTPELTAGSAATTAFASSSFAASKTAAPPASSENGPPDLSEPLT